MVFARGALALDRYVEVALRAVCLAAAGCADPPGADSGRKAVWKFTPAQFGDDSSLITGLDLEPHSVAESQDSLGSARVALSRHGLCRGYDRMVDLVERMAEVGQC